MTSVIINGARTPMGRLLGNLKDLPATHLGSVAIAAALERSGVAADQVQYVIMGQVLQAGTGQMPARQAAVKAGIPYTVFEKNPEVRHLSDLFTVQLIARYIEGKLSARG